MLSCWGKSRTTFVVLVFVFLLCTAIMASTSTRVNSQILLLLSFSNADTDRPDERHRVARSVGDGNGEQRQQLLHTAVRECASLPASAIFSLEVLDKSTGSFLQVKSETYTLPISSTCLSVVVTMHVDTHSTMLAIGGRAFDDTNLVILGQELTITSVSGMAHAGTGLNTWDASICLAKYLERHAAELVVGKRVLELGAGTGLASIAASLCGASYVQATDLGYALENLQSNFVANGLSSSSSHVSLLDWSDSNTYPLEELAPFELLLGADIVWLENLLPDLVKCVDALLSRESSLLLLAHQTRSARTDLLLFSLLQEHRLDAELVPIEELDPRYRSEKINVFQVRRRPRDDCDLII